METTTDQLTRIEEQNRRIEEKLSRVLGVLFPDEQALDERAFLDSLDGMSVDEMVKANRKRNKQIKAEEAKEAKA